MATPISYSEDAAGRFEGLDEHSADVVVVDELQTEEPDAGKIVLTKEQYEELNKKKDSTEALTAGLQNLAANMRPQVQAPKAEAPAPMPDLDMNELERQAFTAGGFAKAVETVAERKIGQALAPLAHGSLMQQKKLLALDPNTKEYFTKFETEIEAKVQGAPANIRFAPNVYEMAYQQVLFEHQADIINDKAAKIAEEAVKKALAEAGVGAGTEAPRKVALYQENSTMSAVSPNMAAERAKKLTITTAEAEAMRLKAMDPTDPDQVRSFIKYYRRTK